MSQAQEKTDTYQNIAIGGIAAYALIPQVRDWVHTTTSKIFGGDATVPAEEEDTTEDESAA